MVAKRRPLAERFWEKIDIPDDLAECWIYTGYHDCGGYGKLWADAPSTLRFRTHRISYALARDIHPADLPSNVVVRHTCDNPPCVNPSHLVGGTQADNMRDMSERKRARNQYQFIDGKCSNGHDITIPSNIQTYGNGRERCRACVIQSQANFRARRHAAKRCAA